MKTSRISRYCLFFILLTPLTGFAQHVKDSLLNLIRAMPEDTSKMDVYFNYGELMEHVNLDTASSYYEKARQISEKFGHVKGKIKYISYHSYILNMRGKLDEAYRWNKEALTLARENNLKLEEAKSLANLANSHNFRGELDSALHYYIAAAALFDSLHHTRHLHILYMNIGVAFDALQQYEKAIEYQKKSIAQSRIIGDSVTLVRGFINMGSSMNSMRMYDSAMRCLTIAINYTKRHGYTGELYNATLNYANTLARTDKKDESLKAFRNALTLAKELDYPSGMATAMNGIAMVLYEQKKYREADQYATPAMKISEEAESGVLTDLRQQYKLIADIKFKLGQPEIAYRYLEKYVTLNDSLSGSDIKRMTADLERRYQVAQKDKEIAQKELMIKQAETEVQIKNTQLAVVAGGVLIVLLILFLLYRFYDQRQKLQQQMVVSLQQEQEVVRLKSNLEGQQAERMRIAKEIHDDIGSGLTSLVFLASALPDDPNMNSRKDKISGIARQLVNQMNEIVWSLNSDQDSLEDLVIYIRHSISEMTDTVGMSCEFHIPSNIPDVHVSGAQRRHVFLVIKEAVHNAIKHAQATKVMISMTFTDTIQIRIEDNGKGISDSKRNGNGLKNMQYRMTQAGGDWKLLCEEPVKIELSLPLARAV